jgi:hypothetical protein
MRDTIQTKEYFDKGIAFKQKTIDRDKNSINEIPSHSGRAMDLFSLCERSASLCSQRYSRGDALADMEPSIRQMLQLFQLRSLTLPTLDLEPKTRAMWSNLTLSQLYDHYTCLAFAVSQRYPAESYHKLLQYIGHAGEDGLLDRVAVRMGEQQRPVAAAAKFSKEYKALVAVIDAAAEARPALLKTYVENWYKKHMRGSALYGTDKSEAYDGYWSFEAALVAMLWDIDDSAFADHPHYPADLVRHYRTPAG